MSELLFTADIDIKILEQKLKKVDEDFIKVARDAAQAGSVIDKIFKQAATDSINGMILKLNELQNAYNNLSKADRATQGSGLITQINSLSASIETAKNQFNVLETAAVGSIDSMVAKMSELQGRFSALSATDRGGSIGVDMQKEIQLLSKSIEDAKGEFVSMESVAEDSINGMITKLIELQRQYNNLSASDRVTVGSGLQDQMKVLGSDIENAKKQFVSLSNVSEDSVQGMTVKLQELNRQFNQLSAVDRGGSVGIKLAQDMAILSGEIDQVNMKMRAMAGQTKTSTNSLFGLNYSIQQIGRELPNIAYGFPLFIMAISNNLPILTDSISQARKENELLKQSGQSSTPVWKQVASSIFSWQTAMIGGVTLMTVFGSKIPGLISNLLRMKDGLKLTSEELKSLNESFAKSAGTEIGKLNSLFDALNNAKEGTIDYTEAKGAIIDQYSKNLEGMDAEYRELINVKGAYEELTKAIYETAKAKSLQELRSDLGEKLIKETTPEFENLSKLLATGVNSIYAQTIMDAARYGKELSIDAQRVVDSFTTKKTVNSDQIVGTDNLGNVQYGKKVIDYNPVVESMNKIKKVQEDTNSAMKEGEKYADAVFGSNTQSKVKNLVKELEVQLKVAQSMPQDSTANIVARNQAIKAIEDQIKAYKELGVEKEKGSGKQAEEELTKAKQALMNAIIASDQKEITFQAAKIALLEKELELRKWIAYEAVAFAKGDITQTDRSAAKNPNLVTPKGLETTTDVTKMGITGINIKGNTSSNIKGQLIELIAVDKTGPTFKKVGLETDKLNKKVKKDNEQAAKDQEKLDKDAFDSKMDKQEAILNYSRQFTSELINQLDLTEGQNSVLNGMADTVSNLAAGFLTGNPTDFLAAAFSGASTLMSAIFSGSGEDSTTKALERTNQLLEQQSAILASQDGGESYFLLAAKQYKDYGTAIELTNSKLQDSYIITKEEQAKLLALPTKPMEYTGNDPFEKAQYKKELEEYNKARKEIDAVNSEITAGMNERKNWTPEQFIAAYAAGSLILDQQQIDWLAEVTEKQKARAELLQETFRQALGFDSSEVSDSIFNGIDEGLKLGENSLGGFAQSFGDLMKKALMQSVTDAMNLDITNTFLPAYQKAIEDAIITPEERANLESIYENLVRKAETDSANIGSITDKYGTSKSSTAITGITASLTEETGSLLAGLITGMRIDTKQTGIDIRSMLNFSQNQLEIMDQQLSVLNQVEKNTRPIYRLEAIENGIKEMNTNIKNLG